MYVQCYIVASMQQRTDLWFLNCIQVVFHCKHCNLKRITATNITTRLLQSTSHILSTAQKLTSSYPQPALELRNNIYPTLVTCCGFGFFFSCNLVLWTNRMDNNQGTYFYIIFCLINWCMMYVYIGPNRYIPWTSYSVRRTFNMLCSWGNLAPIPGK